MTIEARAFEQNAESERHSLVDLNEIDGGDVDWSHEYRRIFLKAPVPPGLILDVGANDTRFDNWLRGNLIERRVISFDIRALKHIRGEMYRGTAKALPFRDNSFDSVVSFHALPLFATRNVSEKQLMTEMLRVVKKQVLIWPLPSRWISPFLNESEAEVTKTSRKYLAGLLGERKDLDIHALHSVFIRAGIGPQSAWILKIDKK